MRRSKLRRQIAFDAARLLYDRSESEYLPAKLKAARRRACGWLKPADLPSNVEIRDQVEILTRLYEGSERRTNLCDMRLEALCWLRRFKPFRPRLIGSVLTGHIRAGSDIDIHLFSNSSEPVSRILDAEGLVYSVVWKRIRKNHEAQFYLHIHVQERYPLELSIYPVDKVHEVPKSSITGKAIERASIAQLEQLLRVEYPGMDLQRALEEMEEKVDRFRVYESLLLPLGEVRENVKHHPEGDVFYHSLQVFKIACGELAHDEEFLLAALLHDVGKGIDRNDHVTAGLEALDGFITERTAWLIEHHMLIHTLHEGSLGARARRRLQSSESYEELLLLGECDRAGRKCGVEVPELEDVFEYLRQLAG